jgi:hypothetical protein
MPQRWQPRSRFGCAVTTTAIPQLTGNTFGQNRFAWQRDQVKRSSWHGTLLEDKRDHTGTMYRRNRVYDPATGPRSSSGSGHTVCAGD